MSKKVQNTALQITLLLQRINKLEAEQVRQQNDIYSALNNFVSIAEAFQLACPEKFTDKEGCPYNFYLDFYKARVEKFRELQAANPHQLVADAEFSLDVVH